MLIAQVTDIHLGFDPGNPDEANMQRLQAVIERLVSGPDRPDLVLLTGDLTENGDATDFARLAQAVSPLTCPVLPIPGNHDVRETLLAKFPGARPMAGGFVQYAHRAEGLRVVMVDTLEPGRHGGAFCEARATWLAAELAAHSDEPVLIAMHHPPFPAGIAWMDTDPGEPWVARFADAIAGHPRIVGIVSGHVHRATVCQWRGVTASICPSSAPSVALDLNPIDPERPDGRALIADEPAGFALHRWDGGTLVTHFAGAGAFPTLARFDANLQPMIRAMVAERP